MILRIGAIIMLFVVAGVAFIASCLDMSMQALQAIQMHCMR